MISPPLLKKGDKIGIVAPAGAIQMENLRPSLDILHSWGLEIELGANLNKAFHQFSGRDDQRSEDLQHMLDEKSIKAILCARGGYGTLRIIDQLNFNAFSKNPKWIIGFSDITVLHSHIQKNFGIQTLHAPMALQFAQNAEATESIRKALFHGQYSFEIVPHPLNRLGSASAEVTGGNLSLLYALQGSASDADTKDKFLFIEDLGEQLYHLDRMMVSLRRAGKLAPVAGLIVGGMSDMKEGSIPFGKTFEEIILDAVSQYNYPVCFNFPAGHINKNLALALGLKARLDVLEKEVSLNYLQ